MNHSSDISWLDLFVTYQESPNSMMDAMDSQNCFNILIDIILEPIPEVESTVREVFENFNSHKKPGLVQFWACSIDPDSEDGGCNLMLTDITCNSTQDQGLDDYRKRCVEKLYPSVGIETNVGNWLAGRAVQTGIADHRTKHHVLDQEDQHSADVGGMGQLVLPVYDGQGKFAGIIEYVTPVPKECYMEDFEQVVNLLKDAGLKSTYMGKTIKVDYNGDIIRFTLPLSAKFSDLHTEVTKRLPELQHQIFHLEYKNTEGIRLPMSSDDDLRICMAGSSSKGAKFIRMFAFVEHGGEAMKGLNRKPYGIIANTELLQA